MRKAFIIISIVLLLMVSNHVFGDFLKNGVFSVADGPLSFLTRQSIKIKAWYEKVKNSFSAVEELQELRQENALLLSKVGELDRLKRENAFLREQLGVAAAGREVVLAGIVSVNKDPFSSTAIVNKGLEDGIVRGMAVVSSNNSLFGVVEDVFENGSLVRRLDDPRLAVAARLTKSGTVASTKGALNNGFYLELVSSNDQASVGELVVSSGLDGLPEGLPAGKIVDIQTGDSGAFQKIEAEMLFNLSLGPNVLIIK